MDDKKIEERIAKALNEEMTLPEGLSERLLQRIDLLAQEEKQVTTKRRAFYRWSGIAAAILAAALFVFTETNLSSPRQTDTYSDPEKAAIAAQNALAFLSSNLNKGLDQVNEAKEDMDKINKIIHEQLND